MSRTELLDSRDKRPVRDQSVSIPRKAINESSRLLLWGIVFVLSYCPVYLHVLRPTGEVLAQIARVISAPRNDERDSA